MKIKDILAEYILNESSIKYVDINTNKIEFEQTPYNRDKIPEKILNAEIYLIEADYHCLKITFYS